MFSPEAENLIVRLSHALAPADRDAFRRAAESALATPQCWGPGLIHRIVVAVWRNYFHPPADDPAVHHLGARPARDEPNSSPNPPVEDNGRPVRLFR